MRIIECAVKDDSKGSFVVALATGNNLKVYSICISKQNEESKKVAVVNFEKDFGSEISAITFTLPKCSVFVAYGPVIEGINIKGKTFFEFDTNYMERISLIHVNESHLFACIGSQIAHFVNGTEANEYSCPARITAMQVIDSNIVLGLLDGSILFLCNFRLIARISLRYSISRFTLCNERLFFLNQNGYFGELSRERTCLIFESQLKNVVSGVQDLFTRDGKYFYFALESSNDLVETSLSDIANHKLLPLDEEVVEPEMIRFMPSSDLSSITIIYTSHNSSDIGLKIISTSARQGNSLQVFRENERRRSSINQREIVGKEDAKNFKTMREEVSYDATKMQMVIYLKFSHPVSQIVIDCDMMIVKVLPESEMIEFKSDEFSVYYWKPPFMSEFRFVIDGNFASFSRAFICHIISGQPLNTCIKVSIPIKVLPFHRQDIQVKEVIMTEYHRFQIKSTALIEKSQLYLWLASIFDTFSPVSDSDWYFAVPDTSNFVAIKFMERDNALLIESSSISVMAKIYAYFSREKCKGMSLVIDPQLNKDDLCSMESMMKERIRESIRQSNEKAIRMKAKELNLPLKLFFETDKDETIIDSSIREDFYSFVSNVNMIERKRRLAYSEFDISKDAH